MRVLITGGAGYIGSHIVRDLLDTRDYEILVVDTLEKGSEKNIFSGTKFIKGDIGEDSVLESCFEKPVDAVFHFAAWKGAGESMDFPEKYSLNNLNGTMKLITKMVEKGTKNFIFSSSAAVYGAPVTLPMDEDHPKNPENYYGFTKLMIEENLKWYGKLKGLRFAALRYFNASGYHPEGKVLGLEKTPANLMPIIMETAVGVRQSFQIFGDDYETPDGTCIRDYIHVSDLASAHILSLDYLQKKNESLIVNLGSENGSSVKEMTDLSEKIIGKKLNYTIGPRRAGDPAKLTASSGKARELLNWKPKFSTTEEIVRSTWEVYKKEFNL
ncbi:MAG: UDP-glucose 4-epimerase GalE [Leptospiraceae bacterium]|nr:UDP-glucose 4-epimerase GalE [Leptospiraceae bacterium]MCP5513209.1 UDP-glucose 4-epimerase GalE [Leptospiraceae bacterium]